MQPGLKQPVGAWEENGWLHSIDWPEILDTQEGPTVYSPQKENQKERFGKVVKVNDLTLSSVSAVIALHLDRIISWRYLDPKSQAPC